MPVLNLKETHGFSQYEIGAYTQAEYTTQGQEADQFVRKSYSLNDIPQVDMSNETIFEMVISIWGLDQSLNQLPLVQDDEHISGEDLSQLLSAITHEQIFS